MLLVNAYKGRSQIHGLGLFAQEFIKAGTKVWEFNQLIDIRIPSCKLIFLSNSSLCQIASYAIYHPDKRFYLLSGDDDRFTNHSENPNTALDENWNFALATRDISQGEEITINYDCRGLPPLPVRNLF